MLERLQLSHGPATRSVRPAHSANGFSPVVAILIPVFKHSVLLTEAIDAALSQEAPFDIAVVVVDDGCPFPETAATGRAYALAHPNVFYLRKPNGGLSSARNYGIDFALRHFADLEAVYFLDADNRITSKAIAELLAYMRANEAVDWVYPNIDKFGIEWNGNYTTAYSRLLHLTFDNICEAGSLVSRRLLDAGIRFDESMKSGFEDWEFWLQAIDKGFTGCNHPFSGFEYRQRAESMLRDSNRTREGIIGYIKQKHKRLFAGDTLLAWEHDEAPRYAAIGVGTYQVELFTDPTVDHTSIGLEDFVQKFWAARAEPETFGVPPFLLWMTASHRETLDRLGLLHNLLWLGERLCDDYNFVAVRFETSNSTIAIKINTVSEEHQLADKPAGWMCSLEILSACVDDESDDWARTLRRPVPSPNVAEIVISGPFSARDIQGSALSATNGLLATLGALRDSGYRRVPNARWIWRSPYLPNRNRYYQLLRNAVGASPVMPRVARSGQPLRVGFLLPIASFGGVEKVAYAVARALKRLGCEVHLFVLGKPVYNRIPDNDGVFKTINFLADDYPLWGGPNIFSGHELLMGHDAAARTEEILGFLSGLDVVINNQLAPVNSALGELRRRGVKVINYVHVLDKSELGRAAGHPYLSLAFEHIYDAILTCSRDMAEWLHAMGTPIAKLLHIPNAASYALSARDRDAALAHRHERKGDRLRVLFLGRLDRQKGIERLFAAARELKRRQAPIDWRIVGSDVMDAGASGSWKSRFQDLDIKVEPPVYRGRDLTRLFAWADVLVLPSRWEGAPLTIIEAQRVGCVPVATEVGAVGELIDHDVDGVLVSPADDGTVTRGLVKDLQALAEDPDRLARMSEAAAARGGAASWQESVKPLFTQFRRWFPQHFPDAERTVDQNAGEKNRQAIGRSEVDVVGEHSGRESVAAGEPRVPMEAAGSGSVLVPVKSLRSPSAMTEMRGK